MKHGPLQAVAWNSVLHIAQGDKKPGGIYSEGSSLVAQQHRIRLSTQETPEMWGQSLDQEDPLEKEMATHSSILAWRIPWTEEPGRLQSVRK